MKTKAQLRVELARDVIKQLKTKLLRAGHDVYVFGDANDVCQMEANSEQDARKLIKAVNKKTICEVCAKGALFISHILRHDKMTVGQYRFAKDNLSDCSPIPYFTDKQFKIVECLFEGWHLGNLSKRVRKEITRLDNEYLNAKERLIAVMQWIIKNKGRI